MIETHTSTPDQPVDDATFQRVEQPAEVPIVKPRARLIAWTEFRAPDDVPWSTDADGGQALAEFAGRACYQSWKKPNPATATNAGYLAHILEVGHLSVLEHGSVSFYFDRVSRSFTHELIRHRHFSYSQLSQRYVPERDAAMVEPDVIAEDPELHQKFLEAAAASVQAYGELLECLEARFAAEDAKVHRPGDDPARTCTACGLRWPCPDVPVPAPHRAKFVPFPGDLLGSGSVVRGTEMCAYCRETWPCSAVPRPAEVNPTLRKKAARQAARAVLPNATETRIVVTGNYRAWRHFIKMRATEHADVEIRELAVECLRQLQGVAPNVFADFVITALPDGTEVAATEFAE